MYCLAMSHAEAPPEVLQLTAHPLRWRLLRELARSDRAVRELTGLTGEPQNLVSYHLAKLRNAALVFARRSAADRRDTYYALDLARVGRDLSKAGGALHPGLELKSPDAAPVRPVRVLFLCTGNSARSQMAEALARAKSGGAIEAVSAGSRPKALHPNAVRVMREAYGLDIAAQAPKHLDAFTDQPFDRVISLCDLVREVCPPFPGRPEVIHWSLPNPATGEPDEATYPLFQATAAELATRIDYLIATLAAETAP
jgi:ArsR family transcriptional regulator, arsenate/arsenite/antimonite-responsive transcriptional repressor / arsenate reductase (thioredoxin)